MGMGAALLVSCKIRTGLPSPVVLAYLRVKESTMLSGGTALDRIGSKLLENSTFWEVSELTGKASDETVTALTMGASSVLIACAVVRFGLDEGILVIITNRLRIIISLIRRITSMLNRPVFC